MRWQVPLRSRPNYFVKEQNRVKILFISPNVILQDKIKVSALFYQPYGSRTLFSLYASLRKMIAQLLCSYVNIENVPRTYHKKIKIKMKLKNLLKKHRQRGLFKILESSHILGGYNKH